MGTIFSSGLIHIWHFNEYFHIRAVNVELTHIKLYSETTVWLTGVFLDSNGSLWHRGISEFGYMDSIRSINYWFWTLFY